MAVRRWDMSFTEEVGHMSSLVIQCHVIVVNIVKTRADSALFGALWNLIN